MKKNVLITGAGTGIGKDTSIQLAKKGYTVYATTHTQNQASELNNMAKIKKLPIYSFKLDILKKDERENIHYYNIDVLINNAAVGETGSASEIPLDRFIKPFETNVFSSLALTQEVLKDMIHRKKGKIIFITSLIGRMTMPFFSPYSASKYALEAVGASLACEMKLLKKEGIDISVSIIEPGAYATGFNQKMMKTKEQWMDNTSYFKNQIARIKKKQQKYFKRIELKSNQTAVREIIKAVEFKNPKLRYFSPKLQASYVQLLRIMGK